MTSSSASPWPLHPGVRSMTGIDPRVDQIVEDLLEKSLSKSERIHLLRELVREGDDVPEELLNAALRRLMEKLSGDD